MSASNGSQKLVIFDFDGVLVDTLQLWYELSLPTNPGLTFEEFSKMSHGNFYASFQSETPTVKFVGNPDARTKYHEQIRDFETPIEIQEAIKNFSRNHKVAVVSSGSEETIKYFLEKEDLLGYFHDILGFETDKSKVVKITALLEKYDINPQDAVFITDTLGDVLEGNEVGIHSIGVTWGLHDKETLQKGSPKKVIEHLHLLEETVEGILSDIL